MKIRAKIKGSKVHDVGYRPFLVQAGFELGLEGLSVRNVVEEGKQVVLVLVEGGKEEINEFTEFIKNNYPENTEVKEIKFEEYSNHVPPIEGTMNFQLLEQVNKGIPAVLDLRETGKELKKIGNRILDKQDQMLGKQDIMIDKQDQMLGKQDIMIDKQDQMLGKQDETVDEIKGVRQDLKSYMNERFSREIAHRRKC